MFQSEGRWVLSPSDLVDALDCEHRLALKHAVAAGVPGAPEPSDGPSGLVAAHGDAHEQRELARLRALFPGGVADIGKPSYTPAAMAAAAAQTDRAIASGVPVVYQAVLFDGEFYGRVDFLINAQYDADTGARDPAAAAVYEPHDAKLARRERPAAVLQLAAYATALARTGHPTPERMHLRLGDGKQVTFRTADYLPVVGPLLADVHQRVAGPAVLPAAAYGDKRAACATCPFETHCSTGREQADDLSLIAGIRADQRAKLLAAGIATVEALAAAPDADRPPTLAAATFDSLRAQAAVQVLQDRTRTVDDPVGTVRYDVFSDDGLAALPDPSSGDVYFDMEGDPFALDGAGLEYLFGAVTAAADGTDDFSPFWGHDRAGERAAFEQFVDFAVGRIAADPGAHIYHYAQYEPTALKRLAADHGTRENEIDQLLRERRLVDLYAVVRRSLRVSQRSYSIKYLEPLYMTEARDGDVTTALASIEQYEQYLALAAAGDPAGAAAALDEIASYNRYDCVSTRGLHEFLLGLRDQRGIRPAAAPPAAGSGPEELSAAAARAAAAEVVASALTRGLPDDEAALDDDGRARRLLAGAVGYHRRENNPSWWEYYRLIAAPIEALESDTCCAVPLDADAGEWEPPQGRQTLTRRELTFRCDPDRPHPFGSREAVRLLYPDAPGRDRRSTDGTVVDVDGDTLVVVETADPSLTSADLPVAVLPGAPVNPRPKDAAVLALAQTVVADGMAESAALDLLHRRPPRLAGGVALPSASGGLTAQEAAVQAALALDRSYLAVQGPPGSGKTFLAGELIRAIVAAGMTVGVVSNSHKAVENAMKAATGTPDPADPAWLPAVPAAKKPKGAAVPGAPWQQPGDLRRFRAAQPGGYLLGGTAWTFANAAFRDDPLDFLLVDEAGQFALADTLAVASAARNLVLLGDPQQLPQVVQGTHPAGVAASALGHLVGSSEIVDPRHGYFLDLSRRMHPDVCAPVSDLAYRGLLRSHPSASARAAAGVPAGLYLMPVDHDGNRTSSPEEAAAAVAAAKSLIGRRWTDRSRPAAPVDRDLEQSDILVVAPFNRQVRAVRDALAAAGLPHVRVGTVDKFQGQEAAAVIASLTASSGEDLPRGLDFLLSRNRLNVAVSRAQAVAVLICNPALARSAARTVEQMRLLAGLAGLLAAARPFDPVAVPHQRVDILVAGPPCQPMSVPGPGRGRSLPSAAARATGRP